MVSVQRSSRLCLLVIIHHCYYNACSPANGIHTIVDLGTGMWSKTPRQWSKGGLINCVVYCDSESDVILVMTLWLPWGMHLHTVLPSFIILVTTFCG